jgi:hypothetical protein
VRILEGILPRLRLLVDLASSRAVLRDPLQLAELREGYRYMASVCRALLPELEPALVELPEPIGAGAPVEARIAYQMSLIRRTNRLHRAVEAHLATVAAERQAWVAR